MEVGMKRGEPEILIVGAGPTGLVLALELARQGAAFRIVERHAGPGEASRAMAVQARTLELYQRLGFADEVVRGGIRMDRLHLREGSREVASFRFGDLGGGLSPFPFALSYPQDDHERLLIEKLRAAGAEVEWGTELASFEDDGERVRATLRRDGKEETSEVAFLCGCDGAHSAVRQGLGLGFPGGTYEQRFFVADVLASGEAVSDADVNLCIGAHAFCAVFPVRSTGQHRLIGLVPDALAGRDDLAFEDVRPDLEALIDVRVEKVNWFSAYRVHHRVAERFRAGRAFLAGDAGHVHSPVGGQGMNTGIGDAVNLAWKLAAVLAGRADAALLDTYESERIAFARSLVETTDRVFQGVVGRGFTAQLFRSLLIPHLAPFLLGFSAVRRAQFRLVSQTRIHYRGSALAEGEAGDVHGGDRLPWVEGPGSGNGGNFAPLASADWQVHVYGAARPELRAAADSAELPLHAFPWSPAAEEAGLAQGALYLVRPDAYVALATPADADENASSPARDLAAFLERFHLRPRQPT
jgi:2-polyprenyl-6-methoxyphenol hydroxylase-like FAD-dependent oxidoreductase